MSKVVCEQKSRVEEQLVILDEICQTYMAIVDDLRERGYKAAAKRLNKPTNRLYNEIPNLREELEIRELGYGLASVDGEDGDA